ncbi:MAG: aminodeoxychorismate synthase component I [Desulfocapsaceae bacterium]|nr:aminodeoxychorismate synthase component I [Desulfocapsaceae bacterium]
MNVLSAGNLDKLLMFLADKEQFVWLDTVKPDAENRTSSLFLNPVSHLQCHSGDDFRLFLDQIESTLAAGHYVAGWFSYEFGYLLEENLRGLLCRPGDTSLLLADLGVFAEPFFFDHRTGNTNFPGLVPEAQRGVTRAGSIEQSLDVGHASSVPGACYTEPSLVRDCQVEDIHPSQSHDAYLQAIQAIQEYIKAGDTYQVNYTLKLLFDFDGSPEAFYKTLRRNQSVAYGAYLRFGEQQLLSFSPELFFKKDAESIEVRPMKGTMKRGRFPKEDLEQARQLSSDEKNRSENVMIVDLLRNDLGRLMHDLGDGPVQTRSLFDVERYETLLQMTSTVVAAAGQNRLASLTLLQLFQALFPCGSVTGAPKIRTMEIINELEPERRGVYTGAIGYLAPSGETLFNVPIRTVSLRGAQGEMGIGSGIVADSDPEQEWQECLLKGKFLTSFTPAFQLIETLLWEPETGYWLLADHLERLHASADYFLFCCDLSLIEQQLHQESCLFSGVPMRVRLTLAKEGVVTVTSLPCSLPVARSLPHHPDLRSADLPRIALSPVRTDSSISWYFHKTTRREVYDREFKRALAQGLLDYCFLNERAELTEGCISNIILYRKGVYVTPSLQCGLLAGIMRKHLLRDTQIPLREEVLTLDDLRQAEAVFLCNSVRGVVQVAGTRELEIVG